MRCLLAWNQARTTRIVDDRWSHEPPFLFKDNSVLTYTRCLSATHSSDLFSLARMCTLLLSKTFSLDFKGSWTAECWLSSWGIWPLVMRLLFIIPHPGIMFISWCHERACFNSKNSPSFRQRSEEDYKMSSETSTCSTGQNLIVRTWCSVCKHLCVMFM